MRVLRRALKSGVFAIVGAVDQALAEILPAVAEPIGPGKGKGVLREVGGAEADEAKKLLLLFAGCRAAGVLELH